MVPNEDHIRELLKREIEWLDRHTQTQIHGIDRHTQTQILHIEKATKLAMDSLNERLKDWPGKMDAIEKKVAGFEGKALVFGGIAGSIVSFIASAIASVIIFRILA